MFTLPLHVDTSNLRTTVIHFKTFACVHFIDANFATLASLTTINTKDINAQEEKDKN